jgi:hypothetical protein
VTESLPFNVTVITPPVQPVDPGQPPQQIVATPPKLKAKFAKVKPRFSGKNVLLPIKLTVAIPAGVPLAAACKGKAAMQGITGKKTLGKTTAVLKASGGKCTVAGTLKLKKKSAAGKKVTVTVKFAGNAASAGFSSKITVKIPKR